MKRPRLHILVPIDFCSGTTQALDFALNIAADLSVRFTLLHIHERSHGDAPGAEATIDEFERLELTDAKAELDQLIASVAIRFETQGQIRHGPAGECIVRCAAECGATLILMPPHLRTGLRHLFLESVAEEVIRHAACPVLVVRENRSFIDPGSNGHAPFQIMVEPLLPCSAVNVSGRSTFEMSNP